MSGNGEKTLVRDLTQGSVVRQLFVFAAPLFVANALQAVYNLVDMIVVGQIINGSGNSRLNLLVALLDGMLARVGLAYMLGFGLQMGCRGFWYGDALAGFMPFVIGTVFYLSGKWRGKAAATGRQR